MTDKITPSVRQAVFNKYFGVVLEMAIIAAETAKSEDYKSKESVLADSLKASAVTRYVALVDLFDDGTKIEIMEYLLEYQTDWDAIAAEVYEKMDVFQEDN